jgi:hypothetical protein
MSATPAVSLTGLSHIIKYCSLAVGGVSGIIGLFTDFRELASNGEPTGKVTAGGRILLGFIVASAFFGLSSEVVTQLRAKEKAGQQVRATTALLREINRSMNPIRNVMLSWRIALPLSDPLLKDVARDLREVAEAIRDSPSHQTDCGQPLDDPSRLLLFETCDALPERTSEAQKGLPEAVGSLLYDHGVSIAFAPGGEPQLAVPFQKPALEWSADVNGRLDGPRTPESPPRQWHFEIDPRGSTLFLCGDNVPPYHSEGSGTIVSIPDLRSALVSLSFVYRPIGDGDDSGVYMHLLSTARIAEVTIGINGQRFRVTSNSFTAGRQMIELLNSKPKTLPVLYGKLPANLDEISLGAAR